MMESTKSLAPIHICYITRIDGFKEHCQMNRIDETPDLFASYQLNEDFKKENDKKKPDTKRFYDKTWLRDQKLSLINQYNSAMKWRLEHGTEMEQYRRLKEDDLNSVKSSKKEKQPMSDEEFSKFTQSFDNLKMVGITKKDITNSFTEDDNVTVDSSITSCDSVKTPETPKTPKTTKTIKISKISNKDT
jgi:hypothetical protein